MRTQWSLEYIYVTYEIFVSLSFHIIEQKRMSQARWLTLINPATQENRRIEVQGQPRQKVRETLTQPTS
jgi:hypothetical protein